MQDLAGKRTADSLYESIIKDGKGGLLDIAIPAGAPSKGPAKAKVVMQIWADFQCPFCRRFEVEDPNNDQSGGMQVLDQYKNSVKLVWRNLPLPMHPRARPAANFALEAQAEKGTAVFGKSMMNFFARKILKTPRSKRSQDPALIGSKRKLRSTTIPIMT